MPFSLPSPFSITRFNYFCLHLLLTRASLLALANSIYYLSHHSPVVTWLKINNKISSNHTIPEKDILSRLPKQFLWKNGSTQKFKGALRSPNIQALIREYIWSSIQRVRSTRMLKNPLRKWKVF